MIDSTKLSQDWGYGTQAGVTPKTATQQQTSITKQPTGWESMAGSLQGTPTLPATSPGQFNYPAEWSGLGDFYGNLMSGGYTNPALTEGLDWTRMMAQGGSPVDISGWAEAYRPAMMDEYSNMVKQMAEQAGVAGTRYGSGLQQAIGNYGGQLQNQFNRDYMSNWLNAQEAAKQRQMQAGGMFPTYGQIGLGTQQAGAAGMLGLGGAKEDMYNQAMQNLMGAGNYASLGAVDPYSQFLASMIGTPSYGQATYQPSTMTNILGVLGSMPWGSIFGGGGGSIDPLSFGTQGLAGGILPGGPTWR